MTAWDIGVGHIVLADATQNLFPARMQMALSLGASTGFPRPAPGATMGRSTHGAADAPRCRPRPILGQTR